ncbi:hypothetical protein B0I72DRAFT_140420 [Yarrowia lipolytica]|nr:hypothetical protein YALI1_D33820g [Yarrowia lipolytica]KAB8283909.1 hypothetical protein BKA91DRAFT_135891 [Yarrowia lipolytica]KAE8170920.1 hypothetical protein BKA90DRAFT_140044 [Yarrowia lipolytica]RDW23327.1 hypothetical protein B0I71DRAFT_136143 [Yarrowia lipolytica]RDW31070.1 hypothetical protein B0I72DRAFT_140420 [Yarrowia lipolytica]
MTTLGEPNMVSKLVGRTKPAGDSQKTVRIDEKVEIKEFQAHKPEIIDNTTEIPAPVPMSIAERSIADAARPPLHASPWRVFLTLFAEKGGLDKTIKLIQYTGRLLLWAAKQGWFTRHKQMMLLWKLAEMESRLNGMVSNFSQFRKIIKLGEWLGPVEDLVTTKNPLTSLAFQSELMEVINTIGDDIYCLSKIGVVKGKRLGRNGELMANWGWYGAIFINIKVGIETYQLAAKSGDEAAIWDAKLTLFKLANDFIFCTIDCLEPEGLSNIYQTVTGLASGSVGFYKLWRKISKKLDKELEEKERCKTC